MPTSNGNVEIDHNNYIVDVVERMINASVSMTDKFGTNATLSDFRINEVVSCTYLRSFYRILGKDSYSNKVLIHDVNNTEDLFFVSPNFIKKIDTKQSTIKLLYGD